MVKLPIKEEAMQPTFNRLYTKIGIVVPSRGLIFSRTAEEILANTVGIRHKFFFAHKLPIPECFEKPVKKALSDPTISHVLIIEDDMILPSDALRKAIEANKDVVTYDYPITKDGRGSVFTDAQGKVLYSGTGFILIKREIFEKLSKPYFQSNIAWTIYRKRNGLKFVGGKASEGVYGLHDITFGFKLQEIGVEITVLDTILGQRKLLGLGKTASNDGAHRIEEWTNVDKKYYDKRFKKLPKSITENSVLVSVMTKDGELSVTKEHADKLIKANIAQPIEDNKTYVDWSEVK